VLCIWRWRLRAGVSLLRTAPGLARSAQGLAANYGTRPTMAQASSRLAMLKCCDKRNKSATKFVPKRGLAVMRDITRK